jgi:hypothetical protein
MGRGKSIRRQCQARFQHKHTKAFTECRCIRFTVERSGSDQWLDSVEEDIGLDTDCGKPY